MKIALLFLVFFLLNAFSLALKQPYIVYMGAHSHGPDATKQDFDRVTDSHHRFLATFLGSHEEARDAIFHSYTRHINGFAAFLDEHQAADIAKHPDVVSVFRDTAKKLHTTHSWDFMRLEHEGQPTLPWIVSRFGEDAIIGNLDSGVWPESKSFSDEGYGPVPSRWKGECEHTNVTHGVHCNKKLIGARHFNKGFKAAGNKVNQSMESARDFNGHGSHTLSTAGGNFVEGVTINNIPVGTVKGGSPRARVASYKVCWSGCFDSDIMAGFDMAIHDGVDILSISLGGYAGDYMNDSIAIGSFHAVQKGIVVLCSAGNGHDNFLFAYPVENVAPWIITVAASTMDREFNSSVQLGNGHILKGLSLSKALPNHGLYPLISAADAKLANVSASDALICLKNTLDKEKVKGKIVACLVGYDWEVEQGWEAKLAGAAGMIVCNPKDYGDSIQADLHFLPATYLDYEDGLTLFKYINSTKDPVAYITPPTPNFDVKPAPRVASFSSRGPNPITPEILKPDITAPGVDVIAAFSPTGNPTDLPYEHRKYSYMILSGTSMSCPHVAGVAGLLKTLYPTWSPAAIKSALMTSARTRDFNTHNPITAYGYDGIDKGTPFDYGAGHLRPNQALNPGLIYDLTPTDYLDFLCGVGYNSSVIEKFYHGSHKCSKSSSTRNSLLNLNYPSISVYNLNDTVTVTRTVTNVGYPGTYHARIRQPKGVSITVEPNTLKFDKIGEKKKFEVTITLKGKVAKDTYDYRFGELLWSSQKHHVRSPIAFYWD